METGHASTAETADTDHLDRVRRIVAEGLDGYAARVYLFGSYARGDAARASDIDVAVDPIDDIPNAVFQGIEDALEASTVPFFVQLVDLRRASEELGRKVQREGILWRS